MKKLLILMSFMALFACNHQENEEPTNPAEGVVQSVNCHLQVCDENEVSVFSNKSLLPVDIAKVKFYTYKDGEYHLYESLYNAMIPNAPDLGISDDHCGFVLFNYENEVRINLYVLHRKLEHSYNDDEIVSSIIDWGNGVEDKIEARVDKRPNSRYFCYDKLWINGKLVWDTRKIDWNDNSDMLGMVKLVMSPGQTSSTPHSYLKALQ